MITTNIRKNKITVPQIIPFQPQSKIIDVPTPIGNWAFIDMQNLFRTIKDKKWRINRQYLRKYLWYAHGVINAIAFMGKLPEYDWLYELIKRDGFDIKFRNAIRLANGTVDGGNVDACLTSYVTDHKNEYDKAIIIAGDGDYYETIETLYQQNKLERVISPHSYKKTSHFIREVIPPEMILSIDNIRELVEYKKVA